MNIRNVLHAALVATLCLSLIACAATRKSALDGAAKARGDAAAAGDSAALVVELRQEGALLLHLRGRRAGRRGGRAARRRRRLPAERAATRAARPPRRRERGDGWRGAAG